MRSPADTLANFHWIVPGEAARSAQLHGWVLGRFLAARGIKGVINLRGRHPSYRWWRRETEACARHGIAHSDVVLDSRMLPLRSMLTALLDAFENTPRPFVVKCSGGQDRSSFAAAVYLLWRDGWKARGRAEAQFAAWPYLHLPKPEQRWLRQFPLFAALQGAGMPFSDWVRQEYDAEMFAAWLLHANRRPPYTRIFPSA